MKQVKNICLIIMGALLIVSCNKQIAEKQADPNNPLSAPPRLILGTVLNDMAGTGTAGNLGASSGSSNGINSWGNVHDWNQYHCQNYNYYGNNIYSWSNGSFDPYLVLKNVVNMENEAAKIYPAVNPYKSVGRFIRAYYFYNLTSLFGDVPLDEALEGVTNSAPKYAAQEEVFQYVLNQLDTANTEFANLIAANDINNQLAGEQDLYYGGDLTKWQKLVNSFKLRVLIGLSSKASDATLNVPAQFANIYNNPVKYPLFVSQGDDFKFVYNPGGTNTYSTYPFNPSNFGSIAGRFNMADTYVSALTAINDPRVFYTCDPAWALVGNDPDPAQYKYFIGASSGLDLGTMYANASANKYSFIGRKRYYSNFTGEPNVLAGYKEMLFNIAEAMQRGWITGNAETFYKAGITESMTFYGIDISQTNLTAYFLPPTANAISQVQPYSFTFSFATYYAQPAVQLSATQATAVNQIVLQKYIALFENSGYEAYYNYRRTGVPAFQGGNGVGNNGIVPKRWAYPVSEQSQNKANWSAALAAQQYSADDLNQTMWLLK